MGFFKRIGKAFKKIKKKVDKLGETTVGKAFRRFRDKVALPAIDKVTFGVGSTVLKAGGKVFNAVADSGGDVSSVVDKLKDNPKVQEKVQSKVMMQQQMKMQAYNTNGSQSSKDDNAKKIMLFGGIGLGLFFLLNKK